MESQPLIYLSYASPDRERVRSIYRDLKDAGFNPWMDWFDLLPGQDWRRAIEGIAEKADFVLSIWSEIAVDHVGYFAQETDLLLQRAVTRDPHEVFLIPVRLEPCDMPLVLQRLAWLDLFVEGSWKRLLRTLRHHSTPSLDPPIVPEELVSACAKNDCVLYVGAGLSAPAGLPTWELFNRQLLDWALERGYIDQQFYDSRSDSITAGDFEYAADSLVRLLERTGEEKELQRYLREVFLDPDLDLTERHELLRKIPLSGILTTNFDRLLERTFEDRNAPVLTPADAEQFQETLSKKRFFIAKLYGTPEKSESLLVAPAQYDQVVRGNLVFGEFMENLFSSRTILFLGASLDGILAYLDGIRFFSPNRRHFALIAVRGQTWMAKADQIRERFGIEVIPYPETREHNEVTTFLRELIGLLPDQQRSGDDRPLLAREGRSEFPAGLERVELENIGCFEKLTLEFDRGWNILLGNNGVGKSTIIRAIAAALCGRDVIPFAASLIRQGCSSGTISLFTTEGDEYRTEIKSTSGEPEVISRPSRPLESAGWLALGFSALRGLSWERPKGPGPQRERLRPNTRDLLPLLSGDRDPRLDELKQWIFDLDYEIKRDSEHAERCRQLLDAMFRVLARVTRGLELRFAEIDGKRQIWVETEDGRVPIEVVSQGTASLFSWIGVVVKRLFDVFDEESAPLQCPAVVMVDEIDAHMHPRWQQSLMHDLADLFPQIQFIATSHSPLVVAGLSEQQVHLLRRNQEHNVILQQVPSDMLLGRTDQVLTGGYFGLETTLDYPTERKKEEYQALLLRKDLTEAELSRLQELKEELRDRIPSAAEQPVARRAQEVLRALLEEQVGGAHPEATERLMKRAGQLFDEIRRSPRV